MFYSDSHLSKRGDILNGNFGSQISWVGVVGYLGKYKIQNFSCLLRYKLFVTFLINYINLYSNENVCFFENFKLCINFQNFY